MKFIKPFRGARRGEAFPTDFKAGEDCPPELERAARELGALAAPTPVAGKKAENSLPKKKGES